MAAAVAVSTMVVLAGLWYAGFLDFLKGPPPPSTAGLVAVPTPSRAIPAYTRVTRDHVWDVRNNRLSVVYLPPRAVTPEMLVALSDVVGRVLSHDKAPGYVFTDSDFMPPGTREGIVAGIPAGKRALRVPSSRVAGLFGLRMGDRFDLVATMPIDAGGRGGGQGVAFGGVYGQQAALEARLSNWQKQATVHVIVQNGVIVEPMSTRTVTVQGSAADGGRARSAAVQDVVIAVDPEEVARLTEAMTVDATIWMVPRSGQPDDTEATETPDLRPTSPFVGPGGRGSYRVVETIKGQTRELVAVPRP